MTLISFLCPSHTTTYYPWSHRNRYAV